ncbi:bifunctional 5,10-methylenetetrahydrofolate dehydrogenase/5,10-methenyltetrahydrofolate cyclohydrolase [Inquilinus limosus]|uniref:bifunctional 5,10-methylenetetrahydrofolate dehydrogenase/5,10-methenyltetrahydrofolate cyclohydrolase n=1 Tax=Inquilinus limosus TaxID=171674 RepID=UPI003F16CA4E
MGERDLTGRAVADAILAEVAAEVQALGEAHWPPKLVSITVGDESAVDVYVRNQRRTAERVGIAFETRRLPESLTQEELRATIAALNVDPQVSGIILQRPVPKHISIKAMQTTIHPLKDVEGMNPASIGNIVYNELELAPCTALAAVEMLKRTGLKLEGLEAVVIGHSEIVGKPIAFLLMAEGATVTVCHHMTRSVSMHSRRADAVFVAVGKPKLVTGDMIKPGAAVIDIGINEVLDDDGKSRVVGDVDYDSVAPVAGWITPVPGGVGPVTVAVLMRNTVVATRRQKAHYEARLGASMA